MPAKKDGEPDFKWFPWLFQPVWHHPLGIFRICFSLATMIQAWKWRFAFIPRFESSPFVVPYSFAVFRPLSPWIGTFVIVLLFFFSFLSMIGLYTKYVVPIVAACFVTIFLHCQTLHNNHFLLMTYIWIHCCFLDLGKTCSADAFHKPTNQRVSYWQLFLLQIMMSVPYFFGSIAKMNDDWIFRAQPLTFWWEDREPAWFFQNVYVLFFFSWSGILFDFAISFILMNRNLYIRYLIGFPAALSFNGMNNILFNIGVFPFVMATTLVLYMEPRHVRIVIERGCRIAGTNGLWKPPKFQKTYDNIPNWKRKLVIFGLFLTFSYNVWMPLRHWILYPGGVSNVSFTEEGHLYAWHMKLRTKRGYIIMNFKTEEEGWIPMNPRCDGHMRRQMVKMMVRPYGTFHLFKHYLHLFQHANYTVTDVRFDNCISLNDRPGKVLFKDVNMLDHRKSYEGSAQGKWLHTLYDAPDCEYKPEFIIGGRDVAPAPACVYQMFRLYEEAAVTYDGHQLNVHPEGIPAYIWNGAWIPE